MVRGRRPKPTKLKLVEGTARKDRVNDEEPEPPAGDVVAPNWLRGRARRLWKQIAPVLEEMHILTTADPHALALLCDAYAEYVECSEYIRKRGRTYESIVVVEAEDEAGERAEITKRMVRPRPEVAMAADAWRRVRAMLAEFGMTPSSRTRVKATEGGREKDPFEDFLHERERPA